VEVVGTRPPGALVIEQATAVPASRATTPRAVLRSLYGWSRDPPSGGPHDPLGWDRL